MNGRKAVTIGLLTIATLGLVACAINFSKNKTEQTNASYYYEDITYNNNTNSIKEFTISGNTDLDIDNTTYEFKITITDKNTENENWKVEGTIRNQKVNNITIPLQTTNIETNNQIKNITSINIRRTYYEVRKVNNNKYLNVYYAIYINANNPPITTINYNYQNLAINNDTPIQDSVSLQTIVNIDVENTYNTIQNNINLQYQNGYTNGETAGYTSGYNAGETAGYQNGYTEGYDAGETAGYQEGWNDNDSFSAPIDIRGLMLNILTMPFTFIRQAFNVTMWEGTAYQFNVSNFILALIAIATIIFIIKLFTSGFSAIGNYTNSRENRAERHSRIELNKARTRRENNLADKGK